MFANHLWRRRSGLPAVVLLLAALACGCEDGIGQCFPVQGTVLVNGKPLRGVKGSVTFLPDRSKGNDSPFSATGALDREGRYTLSVKRKQGAPAGPYKVVISAMPPGADRDSARLAVNPRYTVEQTTPLEMVVSPDPAAGAYDLKLAAK